MISEIHGLRIKEHLDHKQKGGKVFCTFCLYVSDEIITALGGIAVGLCAGTDFSEADAEVDLPRTLCPLIKSFYGFKKGRICPYFEATDVVVGETTCDGKTKGYEVLGEIHPVFVLEVPHRKNGNTEMLWRAEIDKFVAEAQKLTGNRLTYEDLKEVVKLHNDKKKALQPPLR
ncbi:2-hydroxyacyl-CoA dehydratase [bacterium]|nr:2-hydroxyacyl-CoA dehydratase [bacterium]